MAIQDPSDDSFMGVLRTEVRNRPVRLALTLFLFIAAALLMRSAEVHEAGRPMAMPSHLESKDSASPVLACLSALEQPAVGDEKTTLDAETRPFEQPPLTQPQMACFPENREASVLFR
jgi:hypothetical protein